MPAVGAPVWDGVVNARFAKPIDMDLLLAHVERCRLLVTMEDHVVHGGFGSAVSEALQEHDRYLPVEMIGWPDRFVEHGSSPADLRAQNGLDDDSIYQRVIERFRNVTAVARHSSRSKVAM